MLPRTRPFQLALTIAGTSGIALSFVPFSFDQIPVDVLFTESISSALWLLVAPCLILPVAVTVGYTTWLVLGQLPRWLVVANDTFAVLSACLCLAGLGMESPYPPELFAMLLFFAIGFGITAWLRLREAIRHPALHSLVTMQGVYIVPMAFWVTFAQEDFQVGAGLGAVTLLVYLAQISLAAKGRWHRVAMILPVAGIALLGTITRQFW